MFGHQGVRNLWFQAHRLTGIPLRHELRGRQGFPSAEKPRRKSRRDVPREVDIPAALSSNSCAQEPCMALIGIFARCEIRLELLTVVVNARFYREEVP
jgi:hypothetical protein